MVSSAKPRENEAPEYGPGTPEVVNTHRAIYTAAIMAPFEAAESGRLRMMNAVLIEWVINTDVGERRAWQGSAKQARAFRTVLASRRRLPSFFYVRIACM